ncbi:UDP-xylose and UDP-N-acetylglucosamine transporter-like [Lepeophtheirus salmonis]|uniref:Uncharacterized protein n=1 Tax=Lepeophtheirus salmonis TaxID=72036 RepID=A0A0K2V6A7_LEPSM|nr:UDP-xylose and UDP-N-acetylglucosamine transporter-like [Lepeophtheirus salmonis]
MLSTQTRIAIGLVFLGCGSNVVFLELLIKQNSGIGNLLTFLSFLFNAIQGLIYKIYFIKGTSKVPLSTWIQLVMIYFIVSVINNYALGFNISMPLTLVFRAGSLMANMVLGVFVLNKTYTSLKYISVFMISVGIAICTIVSGQSISSENSEGGLTSWLIGISLQSISLFFSAFLGIFQEKLNSKYGKHSNEAFFYMHVIALPGFLFLFSDISKHFQIAMDSEVVNIGVDIPIMICYLIANILTQFICIRSVFLLTSECTSLTVTLIITLRKFLSILVSIWYFQNPFTFAHWIGTVLVFIGTGLFTDMFKLFTSTSSKKNN